MIINLLLKRKLKCLVGYLPTFLSRSLEKLPKDGELGKSKINRFMYKNLPINSNHMKVDTISKH